MQGTPPTFIAWLSKQAAAAEKRARRIVALYRVLLPLSVLTAAAAVPLQVFQAASPDVLVSIVDGIQCAVVTAFLVYFWTFPCKKAGAPFPAALGVQRRIRRILLLALWAWIALYSSRLLGGMVVSETTRRVFLNVIPSLANLINSYAIFSVYCHLRTPIQVEPETESTGADVRAATFAIFLLVGAVAVGLVEAWSIDGTSIPPSLRRYLLVAQRIYPLYVSILGAFALSLLVSRFGSRVLGDRNGWVVGILFLYAGAQFFFPFIVYHGPHPGIPDSDSAEASLLEALSFGRQCAAVVTVAFGLFGKTLLLLFVVYLVKEKVLLFYLHESCWGRQFVEHFRHRYSAVLFERPTEVEVEANVLAIVLGERGLQWNEQQKTLRFQVLLACHDLRPHAITELAFDEFHYDGHVYLGTAVNVQSVRVTTDGPMDGDVIILPGSLTSGPTWLCVHVAVGIGRMAPAERGSMVAAEGTQSAWVSRLALHVSPQGEQCMFPVIVRDWNKSVEISLNEQP